MNITAFLRILHLEIEKETLSFSTKTLRWCRLPYSDHPKGCPNYNKNPLCPPNAPFLKEKINHFRYFYLILGRFNFLKYKEEMLLRHPDWSERQATCVLYWQSSVKRHLKEYIRDIYERNPEVSMFLLSCGSGFQNLNIPQEKIYSMEAVGIDVLNTLKANDIKFEIKPQNEVVLVNLLCSMDKLTFQ